MNYFTNLNRQLSKILLGMLLVNSYAYSSGIYKIGELNSTQASVNKSTASGSWRTPGIWSAGTVPNAEDVTVMAGHSITLNSDLNIGSNFIFNGTVKDDTTDAIKYNLNMSGNSSLTVNATTIFQGNLNSSGNTTINVKNNATLIIFGGAMSGNASFNIEAGSKVIIRGNFQTNGNADMAIDGTMSVSGSYTATGNGSITGSGTMSSTTTRYPVCNITNTISTSTGSFCSGGTASLSGNTVSSATYLWEASTTSSSSGFSTASGTSNAASYTSGALTSSTWFRRTVTISSNCSSVSSVVAVTVNPATSITTQPANYSACFGSNATFSVAAAGTSLTYAWQYNNLGTWTAVGSSSPYSGGTTATLTLTNPNITFNSKQYRCVVGGSCTPASVTSTTATLSLNLLPAIVTHPSNTTVCSNANATFTVAATGTGLTYAWQTLTSGTWGNITADAVYSNVNTATLTLTTPSSAYSTKQYRCVVTGLCSPAVTSNAATLTVNQAVSITTQPANATSCASGNTSFSVVAAGGGLTYAWNVYNGSIWSAVGASAPYSGATTATLSLTAPGAALNGKQYQCVVSGTCTPSVTSSTVTLSTFNSGEWEGGNGDFTTASNWCGGSPSSTKDMFINSGTVTISAAGAQAKNVTIASGATLVLSGSNSLAVFGNWTNNGTFTPNTSTVSFQGPSAQTLTGANTFKNLTVSNTNGVTITSGANAINGTLTLTAGALKTNKNLKLNFDNGAAIAGSGSGSITDSLIVVRNITTGWHYMSAGLDDASYYQFSKNAPGSTLYTYKESDTRANMNYGWVKRTEASTTSLAGQKDAGGPALMIGYALKLAAPSTMQVTGTYTHGKSYTSGLLSLTSSTNTNADGWQLMSNPYPSYIDWNSSTGMTKDGIGTSIYYYNAALGQNSQYIAGSSGLPGVSINGGSQYIPPMQAFWVQATKNNASLSVTKAAMVIPSSIPSFFRKGANETETVKLIAQGSGCADETVVRFADVSSEEFDQNIDAHKFKNSGACPSLYTIDKSSEYAVNTLPEIVLNSKINMNFEAYKAGSYSISVKDFENIPQGMSLILEDKQLNVVHNFSMEPAYAFTAAATDNAGRFDIYFEQDKITSTLETIAEPDIDIISYEHHINVHFHNHMGSTANISVYDMAGNPIHEVHNVDISSGIVDFKLHHVHTGVYVVKAVSGQVSHSEKIHLN